MLTDIAGIKDPARYAWRHRIIDAEPGETSVRITWDDGRVSLFHYLWLRDNCGCAACTHPKTLERTFDLLSVPETIRADAVSITETGGLSDRIRIMRSPRGGRSDSSSKTMPANRSTGIDMRQSTSRLRKN